MIAHIRFTVLAILIVAAVPAGAGEKPDPAFTYDDYAAVLESHVNDRGRVTYAALKEDPSLLCAFLARVARLDGQVIEKWSDAEQIAFWINVYNACTLKAIIDNYPIRSSWAKSLRFPKNSIRQISGVWTKLQFTVAGSKLTLDHIEHQILRKRFDEPRIHVALVCAAMGCPSLWKEPYTGTALNDQLDDQAKRFLANDEKFKIDRKTKRVYLSPIFKWFGSDFVKKHTPAEGFSGYGDEGRAVLGFVSRYLSTEDGNVLKTGAYSIKYLDYDWSLNEQR